MRSAFRYQYSLDCTSDVGRVRDNNEDSVAVLYLKTIFGGLQDIVVLAVADGVGGGPAGEVASRSSIQFFLRNFIGSIFSSAHHAQPIGDLIRESFQAAHSEVCSLAARNHDYLGMASTLTVAVLADSRCFIGHVGDSRCYLVRDRRAKQVSVDHNAAGTKNILSQAIGAMHSISTFCYELALQNNDVLLLCSDGLSNYVGEEELAALVNSNAGDLSVACSRLVDVANEKGGADNITVALGRVSFEIV